MNDTESTLTFITEDLPEFVVGEPQSLQIEASGGQPPYTFAITDGELPEGLEMDEYGSITGTVTEVVKGTSVTITVTDDDGNSLAQDFEVYVLKSKSKNGDEDEGEDEDVT